MLALVGLGLVLGFLQNRARDSGVVDPVTGFAQGLLLPSVGRVNGFFASVGEFGSGVRDARGLRQENDRLRRELEALRGYSETILRLEREGERLRGLVGLRNFGKSKVYGEIIAYVPWDARVTLNVGTLQGVGAGMPVVTEQGLLAVVSTASERTSQATLISSSTVRVGGIARGATPVAGLVKGQTPTRLVMDVFESVDIAAGSEVLTTGFSSTIPAGIRIGVVSEYFVDEEFGVRRAFIVPSARVGLSREVVVLK